MPLNNLFIISLLFLPIQNLGFSLGFMTLKISQIFFLLYFFNIIISKSISLTKMQLLILILFLLCSCTLLFSSFFAYDPESSLKLYFAFLFCVIFYFCTCDFINKNNDPLVHIKKAIYLSGSLCSLYGILQLILHFMGFEANVNFNAWDVVPRVPFFSSENVHAAFSLVVVVFLFSDLLTDRKRYTLILLFLNLGGLVATGTRGAMISFLVVSFILSVLSILDKKADSKILLIFLSVAIALVFKYWDLLFLRFESVGSTQDGTTTVRFEHYKIMLSHFSENPALGIGLGGSHFLGYQDIHNLLLMLLVEGGLIAFFFYVTALALLFINSTKFFKLGLSVKNLTVHAVFISLMLQAMFEPSLYFYHLYLSIALLSISFKKV